LLQRRYKVISLDNHHNSLPLALTRVSEIAKRELPANPTAQEKISTEIDAYTADLANANDIEFIFKQYGKGGIWGVIHVAVHQHFPHHSYSLNLSLGLESCR
jgi:hypothetical protein